MTQKEKTLCPTCHGNKKIEGRCECNVEWRGSQRGEEWEDCQCTPEITCPTCSGTGTVKSAK